MNLSEYMLFFDVKKIHLLLIAFLMIDSGDCLQYSFGSNELFIDHFHFLTPVYLLMYNM